MIATTVFVVLEVDNTIHGVFTDEQLANQVADEVWKRNYEPDKPRDGDWVMIVPVILNSIRSAMSHKGTWSRR